MTPKMARLLINMADGHKRLHGRGRTMSALESRGLVKRHLPIDPHFAHRFTITEAGLKLLDGE